MRSFLFTISITTAAYFYSDLTSVSGYAADPFPTAQDFGWLYIDGVFGTMHN